MRSLAPATALYCDYQDGGFERDVTMCGPMLGAGARFLARDKPDRELIGAMDKPNLDEMDRPRGQTRAI